MEVIQYVCDGLSFGWLKDFNFDGCNLWLWHFSCDVMGRLLDASINNPSCRGCGRTPRTSRTRICVVAVGLTLDALSNSLFSPPLSSWKRAWSNL